MRRPLCLPNQVYMTLVEREMGRTIEIERLSADAPPTHVDQEGLSQWDGLILDLHSRSDEVDSLPSTSDLKVHCGGPRFLARRGAPPAAGPCRNVWLEADLERLAAELRTCALRMRVSRPPSRARAR